MKKLGTLLLMSSLALQSLTYAVTPQQPPMKVLYENDFESPNQGKCGVGKYSNFRESFNTNEYQYYQYQSAECIDIKSGYKDPQQKAKKYFGGFYYGEQAGLLFPKYEYEFMNIEMDMSNSRIIIEGLGERYKNNVDNAAEPNGQPYHIIWEAYKVASGATVDFAEENGKGVVTVNGNKVSPFWTQENEIESNTKAPDTLIYKKYSVSIPLKNDTDPTKNVEKGERVFFAMKNKQRNNQYTAFDNLRVTTADYSITSYTIKHHLEQPDGTYKTVDADTISESGKVGTPITADVRSYTGYTYSKTLSTSSGTLEEKKELSLNMYYTLNHYPLTYDANTGTGTMDAETHTGTATIALTPNAFTKKDHAFIGRTTTPELTGTLYENATGFTMPLTGVNLYAQRKQVVFHGIGMDIKKKKIQKNDCEFGTGSIEDVTIKTIKAATGSTRELANEKAQKAATIAAMRTRKVRGQKLANAQGTCIKQNQTTTLIDPIKTKVADLTKLTDEEKETVKKAIKDANPNASIQKIDVADDGAATVTYTDGTTVTLEPEKTVEQDPSKKDTDGDGFTDEEEKKAGSNPQNPKSTPTDIDGDGIPNDLDTDIDGDGVSNVDEEAAGLDPRNPDTDGDGISDGDEDTDGDGKKNSNESDPLLATSHDTDKDGTPDIIDADDNTPIVVPSIPQLPHTGAAW